jgi:hypothetical protein
MKQIEIGTLKYEDFQQLLTAMKAAYPRFTLDLMSCPKVIFLVVMAELMGM